MENYATKLPSDRVGNAMQEFNTPKLAVSVIASDNASTSSVITFNDAATVLEVGAVTTGAVIKWIATGNTNPSVISAAGSSNFDHFIPANSLRRFVIPRESQANASVGGVNVVEGLYRRVAYKSTGVGSVLSAQF